MGVLGRSLDSISRFVTSLETSGAYLDRLAADSALVLERQSSATDRERGSRLSRLRTTMVLAGEYEDVRRFIHVLENLVSEGYLRAIPEDPFTRSTATWQVVLAEYDPADPLARGVFDVRSGASGAGLDGTPFAEW